jgi:hypothetical protein
VSHTLPSIVGQSSIATKLSTTNAASIHSTSETVTQVPQSVILHGVKHIPVSGKIHPESVLLMCVVVHSTQEMPKHHKGK